MTPAPAPLLRPVPRATWQSLLAETGFEERAPARAVEPDVVGEVFVAVRP